MRPLAVQPETDYKQMAFLCVLVCESARMWVIVTQLTVALSYNEYIQMARNSTTYTLLVFVLCGTEEKKQIGANCMKPVYGFFIWMLLYSN